MVSLVTVIHVITCLLLIVVVLVQHGQSDVGAIFGGSSQTVFGGSGAGNFLTRFTTTLAVVFMCTSLLLTISSSRRGGSDGDSVMSGVVQSTEQTQTQNAPAAQEAKSVEKSNVGTKNIAVKTVEKTVVPLKKVPAPSKN